MRTGRATTKASMNCCRAVAILLTVSFAVGCAERIDSAVEFIQLARLKERQDDLPAAIEAYSKAIELDSENPETWYDRGVAFTETGQPQEAIDDYTKAVELDPEFSIAWNNRAAAFASIGDHQAAIRDCSRAIEIDSTDFLAWRNRGLSFHELAQLDDAIDNLRQAVGLDPLDGFAHLSLGNALLDAGRPEDAVAEFSAAIELIDGLAEAWLHRAIAKQRLGLPEPALEDVQQAQERGGVVPKGVSLSHARSGPVPPPAMARLTELGYHESESRWQDMAGEPVWVISRPINNSGKAQLSGADIGLARGQKTVLVLFSPGDPQRVIKVVAEWKPDPEKMSPTEFSIEP